MKNDDRDELNRVIKLARIAHDRGKDPADGTVVILGALIRAVELLAGEQGHRAPATNSEAAELVQNIRRLGKEFEEYAHSIRTHVPTSPHEQPPKSVGSFDDGLVDMCVLAILNRTTGGAEFAPVHRKRVAKLDALAILAELATMPVELPSVDQIVETYMLGFDAAHNRDKNSELIDADRSGASNVLDLFRSRLAHILAAKDARIAKLTKQRDDEHGLSNLRSFEIDAWKTELAEARKKVTKLEKLLTEQNAPIDATGKTPGQVMTDKAHELFYAPDKPDAPFAWDRLSKAEQSRANETAMAVLRVFGQNTAETLRMVREYLRSHQEPCDGDESYQVVDAENAIEFIDSKLAQIANPLPDVSKES